MSKDYISFREVPESGKLLESARFRPVRVLPETEASTLCTSGLLEPKRNATPGRHDARATSALAPRTFREPLPQYSDFKSEISNAVRELKAEIRQQHEKTRSEVRFSRDEVLHAIRQSPTEYVQLMCEFGALLFAFSLALETFFNIELVKTGFAIFMLFSLGVYWCMAHLKERSDKRTVGK